MVQGHGQPVGREKWLATCIQTHLDPLTDVQTIPSGEVFLLTDCSVAKVLGDNNTLQQWWQIKLSNPEETLKQTCPRGWVISWNKTKQHSQHTTQFGDNCHLFPGVVWTTTISCQRLKTIATTGGNISSITLFQTNESLPTSQIGSVIQKGLSFCPMFPWLEKLPTQSELCSRDQKWGGQLPTQLDWLPTASYKTWEITTKNLCINIINGIKVQVKWSGNSVGLWGVFKDTMGHLITK